MVPTYPLSSTQAAITSLLTPDQLWKAVIVQREKHTSFRVNEVGEERPGAEVPAAREEEAEGQVQGDVIKGPPHPLTGLPGGPFSNLK